MIKEELAYLQRTDFFLWYENWNSLKVEQIKLDNRQ